MDLRTAIVLGTALTVLLTIFSSIGKGRESATLPAFFFANHRLNLGAVLNLMLSTPFSLNGILYQTFLGYAIGPAAVLTQVAWCISYLWLGKYRSKIRKEAANSTLHGVIGTRFGENAEMAAAIATMIGFIMQIGWELIVGASVFSAGFGNTNGYFWTACLSLALVTAAYTMLGGLRGNAAANTAQNVVAATALIAVAILLRNGPSNLASPSAWTMETFPKMVVVLGWTGLVTNIVFSLFWQFVDMSTWQNLAAADSKTGERKGTLGWSAFAIFVFPGVIGTLLGMYLRGIKDLDPNTILPGMISLVAAHPLVLIFTVAGFVCAMLSTLDGLLLSVAQAGSFDLLARMKVKRVMEWYRTHPATPGETRQALELQRETPELFEAEQSIFTQVRLWILFAAVFGSVLSVLLVRYAGLNIFDLVYVVTIAQLVLLPCVLRCLLTSGGVHRFGAASIWSGLGLGLILVSLGITTGRTDLLPWAPIVCLAVSWLILKADRKAYD